jgi:hypothetical protein
MLDFDMRYPPKYGLTRNGHVHRGYLTSIFSILGSQEIGIAELIRATCPDVFYANLSQIDRRYQPVKSWPPPHALRRSVIRSGDCSP